MAAKTKLFTIGYERRSLTQLARDLQGAGVERVVDVRLTPQSRKKGFSLMSLFQNLRKAGIAYEHMSELGNPPELRDDFRKASGGRGRARYRAMLENGRAEYVERLVRLARAQPTAILCLEHDHERCHRETIADVAEELFGVKVVHL